MTYEKLKKYCPSESPYSLWCILLYILEYLLGFKSWVGTEAKQMARPRVEIKNTGLTSATDIESAIMVAFLCRTSFCIIIFKILGVGLATAGEWGTTNP